MLQDHASGPARRLVGVRIVVLQAAGIDALVSALRGAGALVYELRLVRIEPLDAAPLTQICVSINRYDWVLIANVNAVGMLSTALEGSKARLDGCKLAVAGGPAQDAVEQRGWTTAFVPDRPHVEGLLDAMAARGDVDGSRILCLTAEGPSDALSSGLRALGAVVDAVPVYRSAADPHEREHLSVLIREAGLELVIAPSTSALDALCAAVPPEQARRVPVGCIGPHAARAARQAGFPVAVEADNPSVPAIMRRVLAAFGTNT